MLEDQVGVKSRLWAQGLNSQLHRHDKAVGRSLSTSRCVVNCQEEASTQFILDPVISLPALVTHLILSPPRVTILRNLTMTTLLPSLQPAPWQFINSLMTEALGLPCWIRRKFCFGESIVVDKLEKRTADLKLVCRRHIASWTQNSELPLIQKHPTFGMSQRKGWRPCSSLSSLRIIWTCHPSVANGH